ncbi:hypothetical protein CKO44_13195 [Rubrivivax gelatinosus]|uniref:Glycosyltransferase involved in cell wall biosynthesis n=1 Tax=Rubrivivax gelatinosus TaxID=28068 RepID=A0ABS1DTI1_RUBGE|nr:glycosyltransferase family 4 protein [Rubrivivax gelatinosus]MBK1614425.1 hypothetical protein [Rubrivivax gelatinosus]MBK1713021.1 hypothetical protein [Rubrivivax gelatinosus]
MKGLRLSQIVADGRPGGGSTVVLGLVDHLAGAAAELVLVSQPGSYLEQQARRRGVDFIGVDFFGQPGDPRITQRLARALAGRRFDLTHLHGLRAAHYVAGLPARVPGRLVYTVHGLHQLHLPGPLRWLANVAERRVMRRVDARVFVSHADLGAARRHALLAACAEAEVIHNGVDVQALRSHARAERDVDVAFVGRLDRPKGPLAAARVLAALAAEGRRCVLAGDGPLRDATHRALQATPGGRQVRCVGALPHDQALALVASARVLIMPSLWEGLPLLPMEAMALGVPVVATRSPGTAEVIDDGRTGVLVASGDECALTQQVRGLLGDEQRWRTLQANGLQRVGEAFGQVRCLSEYEALYERVLGSPAR